PHVRPLSTPSTSSFFVTTDTPRIRLPTSFPTRRSSDLFPHRMEGEGHFLALLRKSGDGKQREMLSGAGRNPEIKENRKKSGKQRSEEHTSELQSRFDLVCRLLLEKKTNTTQTTRTHSVD